MDESHELTAAPAAAATLETETETDLASTPTSPAASPANPAKKKKPLVVEKPQRRRERRREEPKPEPVEPSAFTGDANARNVLRVTVCSETGMLARDACPSSHTEEYMLGDLPARCTLHDGTESKPAKKETKKESTGQGAGTDEPKPEEQ